MATMVKPVARTRADDVFFPAMSLVILAVVVYGFADSYFLAGMVRAKLPNRLVHLHGALFVSWVLLLIVQNALVAGKKIRWHMTLGVLGVILPPLMVVFGTLTMFDSMRRMGTPIPGEILLVGDSEPLLLFAGLITWGMLERRKPASHKRLMLMATLAILAPAIDRWPFVHHAPAGTAGIYLALPLLLVAYDLFTLRRVPRATWVPYALMVFLVGTLPLVAGSEMVHRAVGWVMKG